MLTLCNMPSVSGRLIAVVSVPLTMKRNEGVNEWEVTIEHKECRADESWTGRFPHVVDLVYSSFRGALGCL
jgi:hypothetical protein